MKYSRTKKAQIHLYFDDKQMEIMHKKASSIGMTVNEWIKFIIFTKLESSNSESAQAQEISNQSPEDDEPKTLKEAIARRPYILPSEWFKQRDLENKLYLKEELEEKLKNLESI